MIAVDHRDDELPEVLTEQMVDAGLAPQISVLQAIVAEFVRARADTGTKAVPVTEQWPLKSSLPIGANYEVARRACERGELGRKVGRLWFVTSEEMQRWLAHKGTRRGP
jgi:hypothetical protein